MHHRQSLPAAAALQRRPFDRVAVRLGQHRRGGRRARTIRRMVALILVVIAGVLAMWRPSEHAAGSTVVMVTHDLATGTLLTSRNTAQTVVAAPPRGALSSTDFSAGAVLAAPMRSGEILTDARILDDSGPSPGPGRAAVALHPHDPGTRALLHSGMHIAVIAVGADSVARTLADDAIVLQVPDQADGSLRRGDDPGPIVVSVASSIADAVAASAITDTMTFRFG